MDAFKHVAKLVQLYIFFVLFEVIFHYRSYNLYFILIVDISTNEVEFMTSCIHYV